MFPLLDAPSKCPVCATEEPRPLLTYRNSRSVFEAPELAAWGCARCGFVFTFPQPTDEDLARYYGDGGGWQRRKSGAKFEDEQRLAEKLTRKHALHRRHLALLEPLLPPPGAVLDFGCGLGAWLDVLQDAGWETWGLEPGPDQRRIAARRHRMLDEAPSTPRFDLVLVNHVLEHLPRPIEQVRRLAAATRLGGRIFVSVPDFGRLGEHGKLGYVCSEQHISSYTRAGMAALLALGGFRVVSPLASPEWDALGEIERRRLNLVAERVETPVELPEAPLEEAIGALRAYAAAGPELHERGRGKGRKQGRKAAPSLLAFTPLPRLAAMSRGGLRRVADLARRRPRT